jgi:hypothetical protein
MIRVIAGIALVVAVVAVVAALVTRGSSDSGPAPLGSLPRTSAPLPHRDTSLARPWVTIRDGSFVDASGTPVVLRGYDVAVGTPAYRQAAGLGANFVRVHIGWSQVEPQAPTGPDDSVHHWDQTILSDLDQEVAYFQQQHVNVLIDFHQFRWSPWWSKVDCKPGTSCNATGVPAWYYKGRYGQDAASLARAKAAFWTTEAKPSSTLYGAFAAMMARRYGHYPNVMGYEVFNEPHAGTLGDDTAATNTMLAWQGRIARVLHAVDPSRAVVVMCRGGGEGIGTANLRLLGSLHHVALDFHDYYNGKPNTGFDAAGDNWTPSWPATHNQVTPGPYTGSEQAQSAVLSVPVDRARRWGIPLIVGEWGIHTDTPEAAVYQQQMLSLFDRDDVSWARWQLASGSGFGLLVHGGQPTPLVEQLSQALKP